MKPKFKYQVIYRHQAEYPVSAMCRLFGVSRSGYYDHIKCLGRPQKDAALAEKLRLQQEHCFQTYGYRRMHLWLESQGIHRNPKTVLRIMKKYSILSEIRRKRKWRNMGQQIHKYENLLNRQVPPPPPPVSGRLSQHKMGDRHLLYSNEGRHPVSFYDPGSIRQ